MSAATEAQGTAGLSFLAGTLSGGAQSLPPQTPTHEAKWSDSIRQIFSPALRRTTLMVTSLIIPTERRRRSGGSTGDSWCACVDERMRR